MSFHMRFPHFRHKPRPKTITTKGGEVYHYQKDDDTYKSRSGSLLDYAVIAAVLSNSSDHGHSASDDSFSYSPSSGPSSSAPDFVPGGGENSGAGSVDSFGSGDPGGGSSGGDSGGGGDGGGGGGGD